MSLKFVVIFDLKTAPVEEDEEIYDIPPDEEGMFEQYPVCVIKERHRIMRDTELAALMATKICFYSAKVENSVHDKKFSLCPRLNHWEP